MSLTVELRKIQYNYNTSHLPVAVFQGTLREQYHSHLLHKHLQQYTHNLNKMLNTDGIINVASDSDVSSSVNSTHYFVHVWNIKLQVVWFQHISVVKYGKVFSEHCPTTVQFLKSQTHKTPTTYWQHTSICLTPVYCLDWISFGSVQQQLAEKDTTSGEINHCFWQKTMTRTRLTERHRRRIAVLIRRRRDGRKELWDARVRNMRRLQFKTATNSTT